MISLEQVQELEIKVARAIEYIQKVNSENSALVAEKESLLTKLEANQKRLDELEMLVMRFKEDQGRIEDGIIAALDRLSQFEEAFEKGLKEKPETSPVSTKKTTAKKKPEPVPSMDEEKPEDEEKPDESIPKTMSEELVEFFEIKNSSEADKDSAETSEESKAPVSENEDGELDIF